MFTLSAGFLGGPKSVLISTWDTEKLGGTGSATKVLLLPMSAGNTIDWGDGTINNLNTHTYASGGVKTVKIYGQVTGFKFDDLGDKLKLTDISDVGGLVLDAISMFRGCGNLTWTATNAPRINPGSLNNTFRDCVLFNGDVSGWDMSGTTSANSFFYGCTVFNQDVSSWDVSNITNIGSIFRDCAALNPNIGGWAVSSLVTNIGSAVRGSLFNRDISGWDISGVTNANNFANGSSFSTTNYDLLLPAWEAQSVQDNVSFHAGTATYGAPAPAAAHANLIADHTWTITDGGPT